MIKMLKVIEIIGASFLNCIAIFFLISLFMKLNPNVVNLISKITIVTIVIMIILLLAETISLKVIVPNIIDDWIYKFIRCLNIVCAMVFISYFICFIIQTRNMERGSELYMHMMYPGIIPIITGAILRFALNK